MKRPTRSRNIKNQRTNLQLRSQSAHTKTLDATAYFASNCSLVTKRSVMVALKNTLRNLIRDHTISFRKRKPSGELLN